MAAVANIEEVDELRSKVEVGILTNGDLSNDVDMEVDERVIKQVQTLAEDNNPEENSKSTENHSEMNEDESSQETRPQAKIKNLVRMKLRAANPKNP